ncbi:unnamed protein product, partial [Meganyctiphanes norvegica]
FFGIGFQLFHINLSNIMWSRCMIGCIFVMSYLGNSQGAPSPKGFNAVYEDPRYPGRPLSVTHKNRFDILNPQKTSSGDAIVDGDIAQSSKGAAPRKFIPDPKYRW